MTWCSGFQSNRQQSKLSFSQENAKDVYLLSEDDISAAEGVSKVVGPIKTITTILCDEKTPTASMIYPLKEMLI